VDISTYNQEQKSRKEEVSIVQERRHDELSRTATQAISQSGRQTGRRKEGSGFFSSLLSAKPLFHARSCHETC
jgi:hypothetical protein